MCAAESLTYDLAMSASYGNMMGYLTGLVSKFMADSSSLTSDETVQLTEYKDIGDK